MCLCSHPWATCQPDRSPVPVSGLGSPRESGWDAARVQKAAGFLGGALLGGPWCISPRLDSAPPRGFQVQPAGFKKTASPIVSCGQPPWPPKLFWKKDQPPSRTRLPVGLNVGAGRVVESGLWLWKARPASPKPVMHESLFLRLLRGPREPRWKFGGSLPTVWSMVFWSQVTSRSVFGEWVGSRLLMSHT